MRGTILAFLLVFVPRLLLLNQYTASPFFDVFGWDAQVYDEWAAAVAAGDLVPREAFHQPPLYPYALGLFYRLIGHEPYLVFLAQALLAGFTGVMLHRLARERFDAITAWLTLGLFALHGPLAFHTLKLLSETLVIFLFVLIVRIVDRAQEAPTLGRWTVAGLLAGLAVIGKPNMLLVLPLAVVPLAWAPLGTPRRRLGMAAAFLLAAALAIAPVTLANHHAEGGWVLVSWNGGGNLYSGNNPDATGFPSPLPGVSMDRLWRPVDEREVVSRALGRRASAAEISSYWAQQARAFMREQPGTLLRVLARKVRMALSPVEHEHMYYLTFERRLFTPLLWAFPIHLGWLLPPAAVGMLAGLPRWRRLWMLYAMVAVIAATLFIFYVLARLRLPAEPFLIVFAAHGLRRLLAGGRAALGLFALALAVAALTTWLWLADRWWYRAVEPANTWNLAELYYEGGRFADAEAGYRRVLALDPGNAYVALGFCKLLVAANRHADAMALHARLYPDMDEQLRRAFMREKALAPMRSAMAATAAAGSPATP